MNKEFTVSANKELVVTDEDGKCSIRTYETTSEESLLMENKIELVAKNIEELSQELCEQEKVIGTSKRMFNFMPIIALLLTLVTSMFGGLFAVTEALKYALIYAVGGLLTSSFFCGAAMLYYSMIGSLYKLKAQNTAESLVTAREMKKEFEKALIDIKNQTLLQERHLIVNEPVVLEEKTKKIESEIYAILYKHDIDTLKSGELKLVRRKK